MKPQPIAKNTLIKIIAIWVILGVVGGIGFNVVKRVAPYFLSGAAMISEPIEEEIAYAYAPEEEITFEGLTPIEELEKLNSNPFEEYIDEGYRYGLQRMKEEEYLEEFEEEYVTPQGYIDTRPAAPKSTVYPSGKGEIVSQSKPVIIVNEPAPVAALAPAPLLSEAVLVSLITTIGATLNTLLLVFKKKS